MDIVQKLHKFIDNFIPDPDIDLDKDEVSVHKSVVTMFTASGYFTIQDDNILVLGSQLPTDSMDQQVPTAGKYVLVVGRGNYSYDLTYSLEKLSDNTHQCEAHDRAIELVEENKNNIKTVIICIGLNKTFASRPVYQATTQYQYVSKSEVKDPNDIVDIYKVYSSVDELPAYVKKLSAKKQRQWLAVWNSAYGKSKDEKSAFAQANGVVAKSADFSLFDIVDAKVDTSKIDPSPFDLMIPLSKSSLVNGLVYGVVYEPMVKDLHGDWTSDVEIENAAHNFLPQALAKGNAGWTDINHKDDVNEVEVVESYIAQTNFNFPNGEPVKKGSWVLVARVNNAELRRSIESGEITGYSLEGVGRKIDIEFSENTA